MTNQSDIKKLAGQMAGSMNSFDDIKDFQKQLIQSFIDNINSVEQCVFINHLIVLRRYGVCANDMCNQVARSF